MIHLFHGSHGSQREKKAIYNLNGYKKNISKSAKSRHIRYFSTKLYNCGNFPSCLFRSDSLNKASPLGWIIDLVLQYQLEFGSHGQLIGKVRMPHLSLNSFAIWIAIVEELGGINVNFLFNHSPRHLPVGLEYIGGWFPRLSDIFANPERKWGALHLHTVQIDKDPVLPLRLRREGNLQNLN